MVRRQQTRSRKIKLNLTGYDPDGGDYGGGGGGFHIPDGMYEMKCSSVEQKVSKNDSDMLEWHFTGTKGKAKGKTFYLYTVLDDEQKLGRVLEALGIEFEPGEFELDPDEVEDVECLGEVVSDTYQGEKRSKLKIVRPTDYETNDEDNEDETPPPKRARARGNGKRAPAKMSEDEVKELSEEELEDLVSKHELEIDLAKAKTLTKKRTVVLEALAEADLIA